MVHSIISLVFRNIFEIFTWPFKVLKSPKTKLDLPLEDVKIVDPEPENTALPEEETIFENIEIARCKGRSNSCNALGVKFYCLRNGKRKM